jgi:hypothetical protein
MKRCIITGILLFALCSQAHAAAVRELNLEGLCRSAGTILWGVCTGVETQDEALVYTFAAHRMLKGGSADTVTLRMHKAASMYARAPRFAEGQEVLLFLYPESDLGYSSPVGFGQGVFRIAAAGSGEKTAINERDNCRLFKGMNMEKLCPGATFPGIRQCSLTGGGALRHQELMELIQKLITEKR